MYFLVLILLDFVLIVTFIGKSSGFRLYQLFLLLRMSFFMKTIRKARGTGLTGNTYILYHFIHHISDTD
jgi:hypothetical protein